MEKSELKQLDRMMEVIACSIPKERQARDTYLSAADESKSEMTRVLFQRLAEQEEQHECRLRAALEILKHEMDKAKTEAKGDKKLAFENTMIHQEELSDHEKIKDIERVLEVVMRMIPKERSAKELYRSTARSAKREITKRLFEWLAEQEAQHESKLRGVLELLRSELDTIKHK